VAEPAGIEDIEVAHVLEPAVPEEGLIDPADTYVEGVRFHANVPAKGELL
jgi:hypothetical protein